MAMLETSGGVAPSWPPVLLPTPLSKPLVLGGRLVLPRDLLLAGWGRSAQQQPLAQLQLDRQLTALLGQQGTARLPPAMQCDQKQPNTVVCRAFLDNTMLQYHYTLT